MQFLWRLSQSVQTASLVFALGVCACSSSEGSPNVDPIPGDAQQASGDPQLSLGDTQVLPSDPQAPTTDDDTLPAPTWSYQHVPQARCGDGSETGFAINLVPGADTAMIFLQGGGNCWDTVTCLGLQTATHFSDVVQQDVVLQEVADPSLAPLFDRGLNTNPFRAMTQIYVPYCTGDLHAGTRVTSYGVFGMERAAYHVGALNMDAYLEHWVAMLPNVRRVVLTGVSAGGYGALLNWTRVRTAFGNGVRVDVLDDSGPPIDPGTELLWTTMREAWGLSFPEGCGDCATGPSRWLPHYAITVPAPARVALLAHQQDEVIGQFLTLTGSAQAQALDAMRATTGPRQKLYLVAGDNHTMLDDQPWPVTSTGVALGAWLQQFLQDEPTWDHQGP